ncbi:MAG: glycerate kinase [Saprospiraceae bacterium]|nr:glycerate kinase [Saprospiraceae bacterium]
MLCDVTNPLYGQQGASQVFAPQKGADAAAVQLLDDGLKHFSIVVARTFGKDFSQKAGAGAAGGLGFGAMAFLGAVVRFGASTIMELVGFEEVVKDVDLVITGEGKLDGQTSRGKLVGAVCEKANAAGVPVVAICGDVEATQAEVLALGLKQAIGMRLPGEPLANSIARTTIALEDSAYNLLKTMQL